MTLFLILALLIVVVAVIAAGGFFAGPRRTRVIERTYTASPVEEVIEEPVATRRVRRRVIR
ncbi:MAG: hypothetical protein QOG64_2660 [Acidimicrobiaceae bacterium]|nr:hypothetical protein [Acidimicrobiaceae bacterium]